MSLELGGKTPRLSSGTPTSTRSPPLRPSAPSFHQGQICFAIGRHLVHESIAKDYAEARTTGSESASGIPPKVRCTWVRSSTNGRRREAERILNSSVAAGARVTAGGHRKGLFFQPTVLEGVKPACPFIPRKRSVPSRRS